MTNCNCVCKSSRTSSTSPFLLFHLIPVLSITDAYAVVPGSERGNKEIQLADVLSPVSKKKTGRAYVALARAHSEKYASKS